MYRVMLCGISMFCFLSAQADTGSIYKCVQGEGIVYQQSPCPDGERLEVTSPKGVTQYTPAAPKPYSWADRVNEQFKRQQAREDYLAGERDNPYLPQKAFSDGHKTQNCVKASKALDKHQSIMKAGYGAGAGNYLRKRKQSLEHLVREHCQ
ncbi:MAG: DUF4124 domain-containing protein [Gammaproteobacteria bacterium]|nr:DUF4124 domain-containing protein [Gammaproteobacteria bacterium]